MFSALTRLEQSIKPEGAVENHVVEGGLGDTSDPAATRLDVDENAIEHVDGQPPVRDRSGNDMLITISEARELDRKDKSKALFVRAGILRKLHLRRHAPSQKMSEFIIKLY